MYNQKNTLKKNAFIYFNNLKTVFYIITFKNQINDVFLEKRLQNKKKACKKVQRFKKLEA